jgi:hypothetical protein
MVDILEDDDESVAGDPDSEEEEMGMEEEEEEEEPLKQGETVHWHHLEKSGEIPGVRDDPRARASNRKVVLRGGAR